MIKRLKYEIFLTATVSSYFVLFYIFLKAYLSEAKTHLIAINTYGEAYIELIMFLFFFPFVIWEFVSYINSQKEKN